MTHDELNAKLRYYFYRNISFYTRIFSGGVITPAQLFYNIARRTVGEIGMKDCIVFDEITKLRFPNPSDMMGKLKDYMVDGYFERGPKKATSLCSLILMGNIDVTGYVPAEDINYALPEFMRNDTAFIIRAFKTKGSHYPLHYSRYVYSRYFSCENSFKR